MNDFYIANYITSIIFSTWKRTLDRVGVLLKTEDVVFARVDGGINPSQRRAIFQEFCDNPCVRVLLMTIGTGAVG